MNNIPSFKVIFFDFGIFTVDHRNLDHRAISSSGSSSKAFWNSFKSSNLCCQSESKCTTYLIFSPYFLTYSAHVSRAHHCQRFTICLIVTIGFHLYFSCNFLVMQFSCLWALWRWINSRRSSRRACIKCTGDHCVSAAACTIMAENWAIDQLPSIWSNLFVKMSGTTRQVPLQMLNHRAG